MKKSLSKRVALLGMLAALTVALSFAESLLPPLPFLPPGFKIGIANIAVMYAIFCLDIKAALSLAVVKSGFMLFTSGGYAFALSLCGSVASLLVMFALFKIFKERISYIAVSVVGALFHNAAQLTMVCVITSSFAAVYYSPVLVFMAVICGSATAALIGAAMPLIKKI
ncbi:MAG: Gx transporter family protein [Oscillospiraceae bacterium]|nr:Gx transporter family protein [Oscillospiraceae bacterium]